MRRTLLATFAALALTAPAVEAAPAYHGGCGFATVTAGLGADERTYTGVIHATVAVETAEAVPVTVTCQIRYDGVVRHSTTFAGTTVVAAAAPLTYTAREGESGQLCELVDVGGDGVDHASCDAHGWYESRDLYACVTWVPLPDPGRRSHDEDALCREVRDVLSAVLDEVWPA